MTPTFVVVDDEREVCEVLRLFFESRGHRVFFAHDGEAGLALVRKHKPAAVFLDVAMPKMNGYEALAEIRKDPAIAETPVMMITGVVKDSGGSEDEWARSAGAQALLAKPFRFDELMEKIRAVTGLEI